jgi:hypothetical protein
MKKTFLVAAGLALCFGFVPIIGNASTLLGLPSQGSYQKHQEATKTFSGTVAKQGDLYVLTDRADKTNYQLVDSKNVGDYVGKNVKVTGTLDAENLTIHVQDIQEIA